MWVPRFLDAPRASLRRRFYMLVTPLLVACFLVLGPLTTLSFADPGTWSGDDLIYDGQTYKLTPDPAPQMRDRATYQWLDTAPNPDRAYLIFISTDGDVKQQSEAIRFIYDYQPPSSYTNPSEREDIAITSDLLGEAEDGDDATSCDGSIFAGLGWVLCPVARWIADGTDAMYGLVRDFLEAPAATADAKTGLYELWATIRTIANICFVIAFLVIIYSQITSLGISNYSIKAMLPRLIIGAILVNISFWLSALAIDISNVLGYTVYAVFDNVRENMTPAVHVDWSGLTTFILSGGAIVGSLGFIAAAGGSVVGLGFLLISALASVAFGIFVAFVILAARQALLTILLLLSPLAFVAYVLPGTQSLFDRWRKSFTTLLMFFPLFALLFGGSAVASLAIMNNAHGLLHIVIIGLAVEIVPLIITPFLIQFSTGLLGRIAGIANTKNGLVDRTKGWARENAEYQKTKAIGGRRPILNPWRAAARATNRASLRRDNRKKGYEASAQAMARGKYDRKTGEWRSRRNWEQSDRFKRQAEGDLMVAEERDKSRFTELQAGHNTYQDPRFNVRDGVARAVNPVVQKVTFGNAPAVKTRAEVNQETISEAGRLAENTAIAGLRNTEASRAVSEMVNAKILSSQELQAQATGAAGNADIMLAGLVTKERKDYSEKVNAQDQLMRHFALDAGQYQKLAMKQSDVEVAKRDKDGNIISSYTFKIDDEYTREAAIEHQLAAGSAGEKRKIINEAGREIIELNSDGSVKKIRAGVNYDHRTTIQAAAIKNGISSAVPYMNDKSYNQFITGEWKGELSEHGNALRLILEGRTKAESLASANDAALGVIYGLQDLRAGTPEQQSLFATYKSHALEIIKNTSSYEVYRDYSDNFDSIFDENYLDIRKEAGKVLDDPDLSSRSVKSTRSVLERYRTPKEPTS